MGNLTINMVFVLTVNVLMFLGQIAVYNLNPESAPNYYSNKGTVLENFDKNRGIGEPVLDTDNAINELPSGEGSVSPTTGNFFTDTFSSIGSWFKQKTGLAYLFGIISAPYNMLKSMNLPNPYCYAIGTLWYGLTLFFVIAFFWGRDI